MASTVRDGEVRLGSVMGESQERERRRSSYVYRFLWPMYIDQLLIDIALGTAMKATAAGSQLFRHTLPSIPWLIFTQS